ncbi:MAG TPA: UTP--glucose-1-phosphate uridylyltransferase GalU [Halanaerobiales bacterium]|nr:UTP--glucose-1-phosphate uridylyltransferase GalU [Halanaerobiales bacterium]
MKVKKAVIPAAGLGTRFLPATKAQPKEMLPIVDKPAIQYIVEEAVQSGIEDIIIITGKHKKSIADHFDRNVELEMALKGKQKEKLLEIVEDISSMIDIHYVRQKKPKGLGHAIYCARTFIGNDPFAVLLGDDIVVSDKPVIQQMAEIYEKEGKPLLGVKKVPHMDVSKYGVVKYSSSKGRVYEVEELVEKPPVEEAPSDLAIMGRYIITPDIFEILANTKPGKGGEIQLTDALNELAHKRALQAYEFEGDRYDVGNKLGFLQATVEFALNKESLGEEFRKYLEKLIK